MTQRKSVSPILFPRRPVLSSFPLPHEKTRPSPKETDASGQFLFNYTFALFFTRSFMHSRYTILSPASSSPVSPKKRSRIC